MSRRGRSTIRAGRGYFITELHVAGPPGDLRSARALGGEERCAGTLPTLDEDGVERIALAARDCATAAETGDVAGELAANRRFLFGMLESPDQTHTMRLIRLLWDSTEAYRAMYYNSPEERAKTVQAHDEILAAVRRKDVDRVVAALDEHREQALRVLTRILSD